MYYKLKIKNTRAQKRYQINYTINKNTQSNQRMKQVRERFLLIFYFTFFAKISYL